MKILDHRLVGEPGDPEIKFMLSPNRNQGTITPEWLIMHYTTSLNAYSSAMWLCDPKAQASAHLVIARDAKRVYQLVPFNVRAWACGVSEWQGRKDVNSWSISMELDNAGRLESRNGRWVTAFGDRVRTEDVTAHEGRAWHTYPEAQTELSERIGKLLVATYGLKGVLGHSDISPGRKIDPGPVFPMEQYRKAVMP